jgi:choice-of-anchor B domain-containing protein
VSFISLFFSEHDADDSSYDVTDKNASVIISRTSYTGAAYTHQGWVNNPAWQEYLVADDEYDEVNKTAPGTAGKATTYFWDIRSLEKPVQTGYFQSAVTSIDHNQYVTAEGLSFQSNYAAGLRVIDISSLSVDPTGRAVREVAHFDIYPEDDAQAGGGSVRFSGTWANYPYFKSGFIVINTMERGAFVVKMTNRKMAA